MDPFSAATGVAGLISLGIEVCKGLNAYCRDYRSRDSEILALNQHAKRLEAFLRLIESRMKGNSQVDQSLATTFEDCHATCAMCLQDFAALNTKYARPKAVSGLRKQGKAFVRQLQFPFHKDKFDGLRSQMLEFQTALSNCLLLLNYDRTTEVLHTTVSEAAIISSAIILQGQRTTDQISTLLPQIDKSIDDRLSRLEQSLLARSESMEGQTFHPHNQEQEATIQEDSRHGLSSDDNAFHHDRQSTESAVSGNNSPMEPYYKRYEQLTKSNLSTIPSLGCNCRCKTPRSQFGFRSSDVLEHQEGCPVSFLNRRNQTISGTIRVFSTLLSWKVSIRYSQFFLRDFQVQPNFTMTAIVAHNSPAFQLLDSMKEFDDKLTEDEAETKLSLLIQGLHQLFMSQKAWPTDITDTDQSILHRACSLFTTYKWPNNRAYLFVKLVAALVSMGVPINGDGRLGTPLRWFLRYREFNGGAKVLEGQGNYTDYAKGSGLVARELMSLDAASSEMFGDNSEPSWVLPGLFPFLGDALFGFDYSELSLALIRKSEVDVRRLLDQSVEYIFERSHHGQTPLHVSVFWPLGLTILFELANDACMSIIDAEDSSGLTALYCAIYWPQVESVAILLKQNATINVEDPYSYVPGRFVESNRPQNKKVCGLLVATLVDRRTEMLQYALEHLSESEVVRFNLRDVSFLKDNAFEVIETLKSLVSRLPDICNSVGPGSVYHGFLLDDVQADALFEAGFDKIDAQWDGLTPLMTHEYRDLRHAVRVISWFCQKQADLLAVIPGTSLPLSKHLRQGHLQFRVLHRLASILGNLTALECVDDDCGPKSRRQYLWLMRKTISVSSRDPCQCLCAPGGCNSTSLYAKGWLKVRMQRSPEEDKASDDSDLDSDLDLDLDLDMILDVMSDVREDDQAAFIRVCTFDRLGMQHTCCVHNLKFYHGMKPLDPRVKLMERTEVEEIQEEDTYLAESLEELMVEFESRLRERTQSFRDFWVWWSKRMDGIDKEKDEIPVGDIEAMVNIGVRLEA